MVLKWCKILIIQILFFFNLTNVEAQELTTIDNVISGTEMQNHNVLSIVQDSQGFLWIGTFRGLYKYDGYNFKEYSIFSKPSIINNNVKTLLIDDDHLWIGTIGGITILNTRTDAAINLTHSINKELANDYVTKLIKDKNNTIWVGYFTNKLSKYIGNFKFEHFDLSINNLDDIFIVKEIVESSTSNKLFLKLMNEAKDYAAIIEANIHGNKLSINVIKEKALANVLLMNSNKLLYILEKNKIYSYDAENKNIAFIKAIFNKDTVKSNVLYTDKFNKIYVGTQNNSFYNINLKTFSPENYTLIKGDKALLNSIFKDNTGLLWIGGDNGLFKVKKRISFFKRYLNDPLLEKPNKMRSILQDGKGDIYALNEFSLFKYDSIKRKFNNLNWKTDKNTPNSSSLFENDENSLLVGTQGSGINLYNKNTNSCIPYFKKHQKLTNQHVVSLFKDKHQILWIGTYGGLHYHDQKKDTLVKIQHANFPEFNLDNETIFDIKPFKENQLFIGTSIGLYQLTVDYSIFPLQIEFKMIKSIPYLIRSMLIDNDMIWATSQGHGIIKYDSKTNRATKIDKSQGLSSDIVYSLLPGVKNELWFGTFNGLSKYDTVSKWFSNYYDYDGLASNEFNSSSQLKAKNGKLYFGGQNGISSFNPSDIRSDTTKYNLNISKISWYNSKKDSIITLNKDYSKLKSMNLPYNLAFLRFEFSLTNYFNPADIIYKYKLEGLHNDWKVLHNTNVLSFTNLSPGKYNLKVMASSKNGTSINPAISLPITVDNIVLMRWWFISIISVLILLLFYLVRKYELGNIKKMEKLRLRISRDLHDELGSSLTGIAIRSELIKEEIDEKIKNEFLNEISVQSRSAVDSLSDIVWALDAANNSIEDLFDRMESILFQLLAPVNIQYTFSPLEIKYVVGLKQEAKQHLFLIFKEAITNIVKHSNATIVAVTITKEKNKIKLTIHDNGSNIQENGDRLNGHGLKNMKLRAAKINGILNISTINGFMLEVWFDFLKR